MLDVKQMINYDLTFKWNLNKVLNLQKMETTKRDLVPMLGLGGWKFLENKYHKDIVFPKNKTKKCIVLCHCHPIKRLAHFTRKTVIPLRP